MRHSIWDLLSQNAKKTNRNHAEWKQATASWRHHQNASSRDVGLGDLRSPRGKCIEIDGLWIGWILNINPSAAVNVN